MVHIHALERRRFLSVTFLGDLNTAPFITGSSTYAPSEVGAIGSTAFFSGLDVNLGREPWVSDGTPAGTRLLVDLFPGPGSSKPEDVSILGDNFIFDATTTTGRALYISDGTANGTRPLLDVIPNSSDDSYSSYFRSGSLLYFNVRIGTIYDLWRTDGTAAGTFQLKNLGNGFVVSRATLGGLAHLGVQGGIGGTVVTDGTVAGTTRSNLFIGYSPRVTNQYIWNAFPGGGLLRYSVGVTNPTSILSNLASGDALVYAEDSSIYVSYDGHLATTSDTANGVFKSVTGIPAFSPPPTYLYRVGTQVFFTAIAQGESTASVYVLDRVARTASAITNATTLANASAEIVGQVGNLLVFETAEATRTRLWVSDGTSAGTIPIMTLRPIAGDAVITGWAIGTTLLFTADDGSNGTQLWSTDGTTAGTIRLTEPQATASSNPAFVELSNGLLAGAATSGSAGRELWFSDGSAGGTQLFEIAAGVASGVRSDLKVVGGVGYFVAADSSQVLELWRTDGTSANTYSVAALDGSDAATFVRVTAGTRSVYVEFKVGSVLTTDRFDTQTGTLWVEDTRTDTSFLPQPQSLAWGDRLVFERRLSGTTPAALLIASSLPGESAPLTLFAGAPSATFLPFGDEEASASERLYFFATVGANRRLWSTDGTAGGTAVAFPSTTIVPTTSAFGLTTGHGVYFLPRTSPVVNGAQAEFYRFDPATAHVELVLDVTPAAGASSVPTSLLQIGDRLVFVALDGTTTSSRSLYVTDSSRTTTTRLASVSTTLAAPQRAGNVVLFIGADGELWSTDLTLAGTGLLADLSPVGNSLPIVTPFASGRAFVAANHTAFGIEGWLLEDTFAPHAVDATFDYDRRTLRVRFDEPVHLSDDNNVAIVDAATGASLSSDTYTLAITNSNGRSTLNITFVAPIPDANWRLTVRGGSSGVIDASGNALASDVSLDFFTLGGDTNHDRVVDFSDLLVLAQNYGQAGKSFSQGDFTYDGTVDFSDLLILAQKYGQTLMTPTLARVLPNAKRSSRLVADLM